MKKMIQLVVVLALAVVTVTGCAGTRRLFSGSNNDPYDHGVQGKVIRSNSINGTNQVADEIDIDLRVRGKGPAPKIEIPTGVAPSPSQTGKPDRFSNPPFPPMSKINLQRGMAAWHATPGTPIGASVLPPKPLRNVEVNTSVAWNGGAVYDYHYSQGSDGQVTVWNGQPVAGSTYTWQNQSESFQNPVPCPPYGSYANVATVNYGGLTYNSGGWQKQDNYYSTGNGGPGQYPGYQRSFNNGPSTNYKYTGSNYH